MSAKFSTIGYINLIKNLKHYNLRVKSLLTLKLFYPVVSAFIKYCPERNSPLTPSCPADRQLESCLSKDWFSSILTSHLSIYSNVCIVWNCVFFFCRFRIHCCYFFVSNWPRFGTCVNIFCLEFAFDFSVKLAPCFEKTVNMHLVTEKVVCVVNHYTFIHTLSV